MTDVSGGYEAVRNPKILREAAAQMRRVAETFGSDWRRAVADWLDYCADRADRTSLARLEYDDEERAWLLPALTIAQAYLDGLSVLR